MILHLSIVNCDQPTLDNGSPIEIDLDRRGALIGRSATCDWSLPDPRNHISSRHCEIRYQDGAYVLTDTSMNGTFCNDQPERIVQPRILADGDVLTIGHYRIRVILQQEGAAQTSHAGMQSPASGWDAWGSPAPPPAAQNDGWGAGEPLGSSGWGASRPPSSDGWGAPPGGFPGIDNNDWAAPTGGHRPAPPPPSFSAWDSADPPRQTASGWSSAVPDRPPPASPDDIWGRLAEGNVVDWARGGFGQPIVENPDPLGLDPAPAASDTTTPRPFADPDPWGAAAPTPVASPVADRHFAVPPAQPPTADPAPVAAPSAPVPERPTPPSVDALLAAFLRAAGVEGAVPQRDPSLLDRAGQLFHRLVAGLVVMVEARARAKSQMGAQSTAFEVDGNNPIKFARTPEEAIAALLNPPARGFVDAGAAIEDAYFDLQSHQIATLRAMQGALRTTLDRFSPQAIRQRADGKGLLARILPTAREAALWQAYEKEFDSVAQGSDEAFMDMFAKEFRRAYDEQNHGRKPPR